MGLLFANRKLSWIVNIRHLIDELKILVLYLSLMLITDHQAIVIIEYQLNIKIKLF